MNTSNLLRTVVQKHDLTTEESYAFLNDIMKGDVDPVQIGALLTALKMKGETVEEIIGLVQSMRKNMTKVAGSHAIDVCGTGGDGKQTFNISTAVGLVVAGAGVSVAKHGNRAMSSRCGSADVLEALGVTIALTSSQAENVLKKTGFVFLFAPLFHVSMKQVALVRKQLGIPTVFNSIGPFANPARAKRQLIGVADGKLAAKLAKVASSLGYERLFIVTSMDGMDEISIFSKTKVFDVQGQRVSSFVIDPRQFGFTGGSLVNIQGGNACTNATIIQEILNGKTGFCRDVVLLNSACSLLVAGKVRDIPTGIQLAKESIDSGKAKLILENVIKETQAYA